MSTFQAIVVYLIVLLFPHVSTPRIDPTPARWSDRYESPIVLRTGRAEHRLDVVTPWVQGHCTATAVGKHTLLTASHCYYATRGWKLDGKSIAITSVDFDNNDHLLLVTDQTFADFVPIVQRPIKDNEQVFSITEPGKYEHVAVFGIVVGSRDEAEFGDGQHHIYLLVLPSQPGSSGAAIMDYSGNVIAVIAGSNADNTMSFELGFTPAQLETVAKDK